MELPKPPTKLPGIPLIPTQARRLVILVGVVVGVLVILLLIFSNLRKDPTDVVTADLSVWGTLDDTAFRALSEGYEIAGGRSKITYTSFSEEGYRETLLNALAAGRGPDIFMIHNTWLPKEKDKLAPVPLEQYSYTEFQSLFPTAVLHDFTDSEGFIYGFPVSLDTLVMLYHRDYFDASFIASPPVTWAEFRNIVPKLRRVNAQGQIERAGAAIGGSMRNIDVAPDLVSLLMLQNGAEIISKSDRSVNLGDGARDGGDALGALAFYLQFANSGSSYYTWNANQPDALEGFVNGEVAAMFGYKRHLDEIARRAPFLSVGVAPVPQLDPDFPVSYPSYAGFAVSKQSENLGSAWDFILKTAGDSATMIGFLQAGGGPPALRSVIGQIKNNPVLEIFARQALTARSWYVPDKARADEIVSDAIEGVLRGESTPAQALGEIQDGLRGLLE